MLAGTSIDGEVNLMILNADASAKSAFSTQSLEILIWRQRDLQHGWMSA